MNPAILSYLQQQQQQQGQQPMLAEPDPQAQMPPPQEQMQEMQQVPPAAASTIRNPFDSGIQKAIASARESLGMTDKQQEKNLRRSMLEFASNIGNSPKERGLLNNFGAISRSLAPAINNYDDAEEGYITKNNALANQILNYDSAASAKEQALEQQQWQRNHAEKIFAENQRQHNLLDNFKRQSLAAKGYGRGDGVMMDELEQQQEEDPNSLGSLLNKAKGLLASKDENGEIQYNEKSSKNAWDRLAPKWLTGGFRPNKEQAQIATIGDVIRGKLFNEWGYKNQAEFEHIPSVSPDYSPEANLAIIELMEDILTKGKSDNRLNGANNEIAAEGGESFIVMQDASGAKYNIPASDAQQAMQDGLVPENE